MSVGISFDPVSAIGLGINDRNADNDRALSEWMYKGDKQTQAMYWQLNQANLEKSWLRDDNKLKRMVADAQRAGISPLAALGGRGQAPVAMPTPSVRSTPYQTPQQNFSGIMELQIGLDMLQKVANIKQTKATTQNMSPGGQQPTTTYGPLKAEDVVVSKSHVQPSLEPSVKYQRGPDGTRIPVGNADLEEIIAGWIIEKFGRYRVNQNMQGGDNQDKRYMFMGPKRRRNYYPDRTNRFNKDMDIAP